ncbi:unnamed protein product [Peronospora destructor]|uniref:Uncharacterized protein n=1 Tax=Peronospora destructor TaxID=86335 RepID=A0AAV0T9D4_9STRA|nr:unnamed protein product [Peronospora destructor]
MFISAKRFLCFASTIAGLMLFIVGCMGFNTLKLSNYAVDGQTEFGCLCFLGVSFGLLLMLGETTWELFFFFFGFMRYRLGRACIFTINGMMIGILGETRNQQCDCNDNIVLIIEGIALIAMAVLQCVAIFTFGNNSAPCCIKDMAQTAGLPVTTPLPVTAPRQLPKASTSFQAVIQPIAPASIGDSDQASQASPTSYGSNKLPSWMHIP